MSVTSIRNKRKQEERPGFYVAIVRNTGVASVRSADSYVENGAEYERGTYFRTFKEAAEACDVINTKINAELAAKLIEEVEEVVEVWKPETGLSEYLVDHEPVVEPAESEVIDAVSPSTEEDTIPIVEQESKAEATTKASGSKATGTKKGKTK